jgi:hypothetical protein
MTFTEKLIVEVLIGAVSVALALLPAQLIVWGLSLYHINSGLLGAWFLVVAAEAIIAAGVTSALQNNKE